MTLLARLRATSRALVGIAATAILLAPVAATAAPSGPPIDPKAPTTLEIHKLEQPQDLGGPADGLPLDSAALSDLVPVGGVTFTATRVPGIDLTTNPGRAAAAAMTVPDALSRIDGESAEATGTTASDGTLSLSLGVGLYLVEETHAPAGVVPAGPFLVALPMGHPTESGQWLYTVHVYPKNAVADVDIGVNNVHTCEPLVTWTSHAWIPGAGEIDQFLIQNLLPDTAVLVGDADDVEVILGGTPLVRGAGGDYVVRLVTVDGRVTIEVEFTEAGRAKLVEARRDNPDAHVTLRYDTDLLTYGQHEVEVRLYPGIGVEPLISSAVTVRTEICPPPTDPPSETPDRTPDTGVQVAGIGLLGAVLIGFGSLLVWRRKRELNNA